VPQRRSTADVTRYTFRDANTRSARRPLCKPFSPPHTTLKRIAARLIRFDGTYHRFTGKVTIEKFERSLRVERFDDRAI